MSGWVRLEEPTGPAVVEAIDRPERFTVRNTSIHGSVQHPPGLIVPLNVGLVRRRPMVDFASGCFSVVEASARHSSLRGADDAPSSSLRHAGTLSTVFCWILKITNSAGLTGAMPTTTIIRPESMSSWVMVFSVICDDERIRGRAALQGADAPLRGQQGPLTDWRMRAPQRLVVGLEDHPMGRLVDGLLDHPEKAPHADVPPRGIRGRRRVAPRPGCRDLGRRAAR